MKDLEKHFDMQQLREAAGVELSYIRALGSDDDLTFAAANLGTYEALLFLLSKGGEPTPLYQIVTNVQSRFSSQSGIITRIRTMRELGLLEERAGIKKSQVCLVPSDKFLSNIGSVLVAKNKHS